MERSTWTDERLDDRFDQIDRRFDRVDAEIRELRAEMRAGFAELRTELGGQIESLRVAMNRWNVTMVAGLLGVIAAILARGA